MSSVTHAKRWAGTASAFDSGTPWNMDSMHRLITERSLTYHFYRRQGALRSRNNSPLSVHLSAHFLSPVQSTMTWYLSRKFGIPLTSVCHGYASGRRIAQYTVLPLLYQTTFPHLIKPSSMHCPKRPDPLCGTRPEGAHVQVRWRSPHSCQACVLMVRLTSTRSGRHLTGCRAGP
ncbi:hypothetical protein BD414DRAFT_26202 [Trametes punicea]|nr:hypothetical protein BD414DRAFT_26202 [Trametes punicea]